jgi:hypothetical protein
VRFGGDGAGGLVHERNENIENAGSQELRIKPTAG